MSEKGDKNMTFRNEIKNLEQKAAELAKHRKMVEDYFHFLRISSKHWRVNDIERASVQILKEKGLYAKGTPVEKRVVFRILERALELI